MTIHEARAKEFLDQIHDSLDDCLTPPFTQQWYQAIIERQTECIAVQLEKLEYEEALNESLDRQVARLSRKDAHGCTEQYCVGCDRHHV